MIAEIQYYSNGKMSYNSDFFSKTGKSWSMEDKEYLILWYEIIGPEEMAFALERTPGSLMEKVRLFRKEGIMKKTFVKKHKKREFSPKNSKINKPRNIISKESEVV